MLRESITYVIAREELWQGHAVTEPLEAGWASEAVFFLRGMDDVQGEVPQVHAQISPDGMRWVNEGSVTVLPRNKDDLEVLRVRHFGNWLRLTAEIPQGMQCSLLVSVHLK